MALHKPLKLTKIRSVTITHIGLCSYNRYATRVGDLERMCDQRECVHLQRTSRADDDKIRHPSINPCFTSFFKQALRHP